MSWRGVDMDSVETETEHVVTMDEAMWRRWRESVRLVQL